jgi:hypothetical protein
MSSFREREESSDGPLEKCQKVSELPNCGPEIYLNSYI